MTSLVSPLEFRSVLPADVRGNVEIFIPEKVCSKMIHFAVENDRLAFVRFTGGCDGNLKALSALVTGMRIEDILDKLSGITCGGKGTSCAAQLCVALREKRDGNRD